MHTKLLTVALLIIGSTAAQQLAVVNQTPLPNDARYAIIQGTAGLYQAKFKLDRFTGQIWLGDTTTWKTMKVTDLPAIPAPKAPRFQMLWLFGAQGTSSQILLDCQTGKSWQLGGGGTWEPDKVAEEKSPN